MASDPDVTRTDVTRTDTPTSQARTGADARTDAPTGATGTVPAGGLTLEWQPQPADWVQVFAARRRHRRETLKLSLILVAGGLASGSGIVLHLPALGTAGLIAVLAVAIAWLVRPFIVGSFWRKSPTLRKRVRAVVDDEGITVRTDDGTRRHPWPTLGPVLEARDVFVVHLAGARAFFPLAKRGLADGADTDRLRELLRRASTGR